MRAGPRFTKDEVLRRREKVADLYCARKSQHEIALAVGVSQRQVSDDLQWVRGQWLTSALRSFDELHAERLAKIDRLEREAWLGWERSVGTHRKEKAEKRSGGITGDTTVASVTKEDQAGDPRFLEIIGKCLQMRQMYLPAGATPDGPPPDPKGRLLEELGRIASRALPAAIDVEAEEVGIVEVPE